MLRASHEVTHLLPPHVPRALCDSYNFSSPKKLEMFPSSLILHPQLLGRSLIKNSFSRKWLDPFLGSHSPWPPCTLTWNPVHFSNSSNGPSNSLMWTSLPGYGLKTMEFTIFNLHCFPKSSISLSLFLSYYHVLIWLGCIWKEAIVMMLSLFGPSLLMPHLCSNCSIHTVNFPIFP